MNKRSMKAMIVALTITSLFAGKMHATPGAAIKALSSAAGIATGLGCGMVADYHITEADRRDKHHKPCWRSSMDHLLRADTWEVTSGVSSAAIGFAGMQMSNKYQHIGRCMTHFGFKSLGALAGVMVLRVASDNIQKAADDKAANYIKKTDIITDIIEHDLKPAYKHFTRTQKDYEQETRAILLRKYGRHIPYPDDNYRPLPFRPFTPQDKESTK